EYYLRCNQSASNLFGDGSYREHLASRADVLLRTAVVGIRLRRVVHGKDSSRHALGECVSDRAPAGADPHWANCALAEFRHMGAESRPFFALSLRSSRCCSPVSLIKGQSVRIYF